ncbi:MAG: guanosine-3',5'-bis(diphosphate) 3'-diphosphatase [Gammaproteobacteria bacterium]|nr:MAG: guanosine-3',5'-bis(diphosphate) 3'-diphosphatase [Gammaproteobacteria bacterium]
MAATIDTLSDTLSAYLEPGQVQQIRRAYFYAQQAHDGQRRQSGEPYVTHPLAVASILANMHMDHQSLMAALLHDVIEDTGISREALAGQFGEATANLVDGVSKLAKIEFRSRAEAQAENFQKMALAMSRDIRVILVKLADRLHNMRTLDVVSPEKRRRVARETLDLYAPIANRLGMNNLRIELEELGFTALHPMRAERIAAAVRKFRGNRKELVETIRFAIENALAEEGIPARVLGREKHLYSIYQKMRAQRKPFDNIMDVLAFRVVVDNVDTCYRALGIVHSLYKPVAGRFKDYIAVPKANGYQSLHTVLFGMHGVPIEIQIRTHDMEDMANNGIAAHWLYKSEGDSIESSHLRARQWVQGLLEMQQRAGNSLEFIEHMKTDLFPEEIYVFTPSGDIMELPAGSTSVDFAYAVHTDLGNSCVGCRINRQLAPLSEVLQSGQTVEIITAPGAQPSPGWLNFVVSGKARSNIRHFLKSQRHTESAILGKRLLERALQGMGQQLEDIPEERINALLKETGYGHFDNVLEDIGLGNRLAFITAQRLVPDASEHTDDDTEAALAPHRLKPLVIQSRQNTMISFARCCHPIPGDPIIGHISSGRGIVVHVETCNNVSKARTEPKDYVGVRWGEQLSGDFPVELRVEVENQRGVVALLATKINSFDANIEKINIEEKDPRISLIRLEIGVHNRVHLARIMRRIRGIKSVTRVTRLKNTQQQH